MTHDSSDVMWNLEEYLCKKLSKDDARVKLKTLKLVKKLCEQGNPASEKITFFLRSDW